MKFEFGNDESLETEPVDFSNYQPLGTCPYCNHHVYDYGPNYVCEKAIGANHTCSFKVGKVILNRAIEQEQLIKLLEHKKTDLLTNFISKKGRPFSAHLVVTPDNKIGFEFEERKPSKRKK